MEKVIGTKTAYVTEMPQIMAENAKLNRRVTLLPDEVSLSTHKKPTNKVKYRITEIIPEKVMKVLKNSVDELPHTTKKVFDGAVNTLKKAM